MEVSAVKNSYKGNCHTLINSGQPMKKISGIVGHASITMTERMYYHYTDEEKLVTISNLSFGKDIENTLK